MPALLTKARRYCICQQGARACYQGAARSRVHMGSAVHSPSWITEPTATPHCACTNITRTHTPVDLQQGAALHAIAPPVCRKKQVPAAKEIRHMQRAVGQTTKLRDRGQNPKADAGVNSRADGQRGQCRRKC
eukprot:scaffold63696_cov22-Tisochrysis_lutea.AAC.1